MEKSRDSFIFYRSFFEAIDELPEENQLSMYKAIAEFSLNFNKIDLKGIESTMFRLIQPQLEANNKRFINGTKAKQKQNRSKTEANNNVNVNVNENKNIKKFDFKKNLMSLGVNSVIAEDWLKVRKNKKASNTETAFNKIKNEIDKSGMNANDCIKLAVEKSWSGFNSEWINKTESRFNDSGKPKLAI